jgi:predicted GH43/DUF377 family glycosyl hydrolase
MSRQTLKLIMFLFCCSTCTATAQTKTDSIFIFAYFKGNGEDGLHLAYSKDGYTYTALRHDSAILAPQAGKDKLMRDPCIIRGGDGKFHMVWTVSWNEKGIGYASSADLLHWSPQQYLPVMESAAGARNSWAPEVTYDPLNRQYMIYWATTIPGRFTETADTLESGYNHRLYYVTTKDFKSFSKTRLLYDPGFNAIDASIVKVNDRYIMFLKNETRTPPEKNIRIAESRRLTGPYTKAGPAITGAYWAEGPTAVYAAGKWIVYFDKYMDHRMGAVASPDLQSWTDISNEVHFPQGVRHGTVLKISSAEFQQLIP